MQTPLREVIARKGTQCYQVSGATLVKDAVKEMNRRDISSLLVVENDTLLGIFTERDVLVRVVDAGLDAGKTRVADVMTPNPVTVDPAMTVEEAMRTVTRCRCRHLPIMVKGHINGLVSIGDLTAWLVRDQERAIDDLMHYISGSHARLESGVAP